MGATYVVAAVTLSVLYCFPGEEGFWGDTVRCPKCGHAVFSPTSPCPACAFQGDAGLLEQLGQLDFLLAELETWHDAPASLREELRQRYGQQRRHVQSSLGLRPPPLDLVSARAARLRVIRLDALIEALPTWVLLSWLTPELSGELRSQAWAERSALQDLLLDSPATEPLGLSERALVRARFLVETIERLHTAGRLGEKAYRAAQSELVGAVESLEGRAAPRPVPPPAPRPGPEKPARPPRPPRPPLTWDRVWETLLSERTLRALLFLGAALIFAAALSLVIWNWQAFPPWLQVTFLALFTAVFYALGWYVRVPMKLRGSGMALTGVASLLVPLDFYAFYLSGGFPAGRWPEVWLLASAVCLVAYLVTVLLIQAEFFGYLVGVAAGSLLAAAMKVGGVDERWWQSALAGLALLLVLAGEGLRRNRGRWRVLAVPLGRDALAATVAILPVALAWGLIRQADDRTFATALALDWWLGSLVFLVAAARYRMRLLGLAVAGCFPIAVWLTQRVLFDLWAVRPAWHALGLGLLVPLYLGVGWLLLRPGGDKVRRAYGQTVVGCAAVLGVLAAGWALTDATVGGVVHLLLAVAVALAVGLWRRPWLSLLASLLLLTGTAAWLANRGATMAQLGLGWALVAILHVVVALWLRRVGPAGAGEEGDRKGRPSPVDEDQGTGEEVAPAARTEQGVPGRRRREPWPPLYDAPVHTAGWLIAGLALLPPLLLFDRPILTYALGNWIALSGWQALLVHKGEAPGFSAVLARRRWWRLLPQWAAGLLLLPWAWLMWTERRPAEARLGLAYMLLAGLLLGLGWWLRRSRWEYGRPWQTAAHLSALAAMVTALAYYDEKWVAAVLLLAAAFYFASARLLHQRLWLIPGTLLLPLGCLLGLDWLGLGRDPLGVVLAAVVLAYVVAAALLERLLATPRAFLQPLYVEAQVLAAVLAVVEVVLGLSGGTNSALYWAAGGEVLLALAFGLCAWLFGSRWQAHVAAWLGAAAGGLSAMTNGAPQGSSAPKMALFAVGYVLAERGLHWLSQLHPHPSAAHVRSALVGVVRQLWRLFRRPLLVTGFAVSAFAIVLALTRNLILALLDGGKTPETWAVVGLLVVTGLYALAARMFRKVYFVWFAAFLLIFPWTLLTHLGWYVWPRPSFLQESFFAFPRSWTVLALLELLVGVALAWFGPWNRAAPSGIGRAAPGPLPAGQPVNWGLPAQVVAHLAMPVALLLGLLHIDTAAVTLGVGVLFYLVALWADRWQWPVSGRPTRGIFLYPAAALVPIWVLYLLAYLSPHSPRTTYGLLLLGFSLPALFLGRWLAQKERTYALPLYLLAYGTAVAGTLVVAHDRPVLIGALLFDTLLAGVSAWTFRSPWWIYPGAATLPVALTLALAEWNVAEKRYGWPLIALAGVYLLIGWLLRNPPARLERWREELCRYAPPLVVASLVLALAGLVPSSLDRVGALVGYAMAAVLYTLAAVGLQWPVLLFPATGLAAVSYWMAVLELRVPPADYGLALWPGIVALLLLAYGLDLRWGLSSEPPGEERPPLSRTGALVQKWGRWWALPLYVAGYVGAYTSAVLSLDDSGRLTLTLLGAAAVYGLATYRFRRREWLLVAAATAQLAALAAIHWLGWAEPAARAALAFAPVTWATGLAGLAVAWRLDEGGPLGRQQGSVWRGWSRPIFLLLLFDVVIAQSAAFVQGDASAWVSLSHAALLAVLATAWASPGLAWAPPVLGLAALAQRLFWVHVDSRVWPWALALLALGYGLVGYLLRYLRRQDSALPEEAAVWEPPLRWSSWVLSGASLLLALALGIPVIALAIRIVLGLGLVTPADLPQVQMVVSVLAILGLLYLGASIVDRRRWLGYVAMAMLLGAWSLEWLLVWGMREVQWYAVPAGLYLLGIGYLEWTRGSRAWARWIDYAGLLLLLGSSFWQSQSKEPGWSYALVMGAESLLVLWWGSARRLRRFLYMAVAGVLIDVVGQMVALNPANRWIIFGVTGAVLIAIGIFVERRLDRLKAAVRKRFENWE
jgi:hypothetical protein